MAHIALVRTLAVVAAVVAGGCDRSERSATPEPAAADSVALAGAKPAALHVSNVMIGRRIGAGNRVIEPTFEFAPSDTVHVSVATEGTTEGGTVSAAWRSQTGEILEQSSAPVESGQNTALQLSRPKGLGPGTYKVVLFLGQDSVDTKVFVVRK